MSAFVKNVHCRFEPPGLVHPVGIEHPGNQLFAFRLHLTTEVARQKYFDSHSDEVENGQDEVTFVTPGINLWNVVELDKAERRHSVVKVTENNLNSDPQIIMPDIQNCIE